MAQKLKIGIVGKGNVGIHLLLRLLELGYQDILVYSRSGNDLTGIPNSSAIQFTNDFKEFVDYDLIFCAVNDNNILEMVQLLATYAPVVSVSGTVSLNHLTGKFPIGTFYPLQSFVLNQPLNWKGLPIFIESKDEQFQSFLMQLGQELSRNAIQLDEDKRQHLHVAAVFANNFTNHIIDMASHYCQEHDIDFNWLKPLINQTIEKIQTNDPHSILTGPAIRNDQSTIAKHLDLLKGDSKTIYRTLTKSIIKHHSKR